MCLHSLRSQRRFRCWKNNAITGNFKTKSYLKTCLVFQEPTLLPWLTVIQNLSIVCEDIGLQERWLSLFDLSEVSHLRPGQLSLVCSGVSPLQGVSSRDPGC